MTKMQQWEQAAELRGERRGAQRKLEECIQAAMKEFGISREKAMAIFGGNAMTQMNIQGQ